MITTQVAVEVRVSWHQHGCTIPDPTIWEISPGAIGWDQLVPPSERS